MSKIKNNLIRAIKNKKFILGIIGLGYVGLPLVVRYIDAGFSVIGFDNDEKKINLLNKGESYIEHISSDEIKNILKKRFKATSSFTEISSADILILCVPTPLNKYREPDLSYVTRTMDSIVPYLKKGHVVSLESTTYPGTTEEELLPRIEKSGLVVGVDIFLIYSPEREDPGNLNFTIQTTPKVVGGHTKSCLEVGQTVYGVVIDKIVPVSSTRTAEMTKLLENIYRAVNIGLVNEMKMVSDRMGIDIHEVIRAAATKPFGFTPYYPGPGLGGHCIPIDPFYLTWKAREYDIHTRFIELSGEVNSGMPRWVRIKVMDALNERGIALKNSKILMLGIAYKKDVDDMRESPSVVLMELLKEKGAIVDYSDPHIPIFPKTRSHYFDLCSVDLTEKIIKGYDLLIVATDHKKFDYEFIKKHAKLIVDTRGIYLDSNPNIIKA
jgi:UDP-N-acetyl-D-glucosamine dehydrogenase